MIARQNNLLIPQQERSEKWLKFLSQIPNLIKALRSSMLVIRRKINDFTPIGIINA